MSPLTKQEWEHIDKEVKTISAALAKILKELRAIRIILEEKKPKIGEVKIRSLRS
jgi:hypothetical protein